jgi:septal ring factor EnvC (AmiA/AmiB activator)
LFASENFNQAYARLKYMQQYSEFRKKQAYEIIATQSELISKLKELKNQRHEKNVLLGNEEVEKETLSGEKQEQEKVLTELQKKEKELKITLDKKKRDAVDLQIAIRKLIEAEIKRKAEEAAKAEAAEIAAKKSKEDSKTKTSKEKTTLTETKKEKKENLYTPILSEASEALSADFSNNRGKLPWPVNKGVICETYGEHEHPAIKGFMMFNNGVEICANKGSEARAVFEGEVTGIAVSPTGGKLVIIRHGEYLSVYSNLSDVTVKTGQKIAVKQTIGTLVYNEDEGKTSMNLQIWKGQKTMDPSGWLFNAR